MDPAWLFIGALTALHVIEGLYWVRREAIGFLRTGSGYRSVRPGGPFGNARGGFLLLSAVPPLGEMFVVEPWPMTWGPTRIWGVGAETLGRTDPQPAHPTELDSVAAARVRADGKAVEGPGRFRVQTSSPALARHLKDLLQTFAARSAKKRKHAFAEALTRSHDVGHIQARLAEFRTTTRRLAVYGSLLPPALIGGAYGIFFVPAVLDRWPFVLAGIGTLWALSALEFAIVHRRLYPGLRGDRALKLVMMIASPPAAARARAWLARDLLATFHPLAVGRVLLEPEAAEALASTVWRDLLHPLGPDPDPVGSDLAEARGLIAAAHARLVGGPPTDDTLGPPDTDDDQAAAYCPRCHAIFRQLGSECPDCPGVEQKAWPAARAGGPE